MVFGDYLIIHYLFPNVQFYFVILFFGAPVIQLVRPVDCVYQAKGRTVAMSTLIWLV